MYIENNNPQPHPQPPTETNVLYGHPAPYPPLPTAGSVYGPNGAHISRAFSVSSTEGVPFKVASHIVSDENFENNLKSQLDGILRSLNSKGGTTIDYDFQLEKSIVSQYT